MVNRPPESDQSFSAWQRDFSADRLRLLCGLGFVALVSYAITDGMAVGWMSPEVGYRVLGAAIGGGLILLLNSRAKWVLSNLGPALVIVSGMVSFTTLQTVNVPTDPDMTAAILAFGSARMGIVLVILASAVIVPAFWPAHLVMQLISVGFVFLRMPEVMRVLQDGGGLVSRGLAILWVCLFCDISIIVFTRLQRSENEARRSLSQANLRLSEAVAEIAAFAERRKRYLDGLVRVGISATGTDPDDQTVAVLDETVGLMGASRAFLQLLRPDGSLAFRAGRNGAGEKLTAQDLPSDGDVVKLPLTVRDRTLGEIWVERPGGGDADAAADEDDFLPALASHAAIAIETLENAEKLRAARDEAVEAGRAKDTFLQVMSHELRTPLNPIIGYSEAVSEELEDEGRTDLVEDLAKVLLSARRLEAMIADILELTAMEAEHRDEAAETDVDTLVAAVVDTVRPLAEAKGLVLHIDSGPDTGSTLVDSERLGIVLGKVLDNACKFTRDGRVRVSAWRLDTEAGEAIRFTVEDTGIGLDDDGRQHCFDPFWQADSSTTREFDGSGLGLTTASRLCGALGGSIEVHEGTEGGSRFEVTVPAQAPS